MNGDCRRVLASTVTLLALDGRMKDLQTLSTLPDGFEGESLGGHIAFNRAGDRLYVTNRGHHSVAVFAVDGEKLTLLQHHESGGASPRFFLLLEEHGEMLVANEEGGNVSVLKLEPDGTLSGIAGRLPVPGAAFIAPVA